MVVPLKKQRTGKFFKPWDNPDEMNLEEVTLKAELIIMTYDESEIFYYPVIIHSFSTGPIYLCAHTTHFFSQNWKKIS